MGLVQQARAAWTRSLEVDSSSPWAVEARRRLAALPEGNGDALFRKAVPDLERGVAAIDPIVTRWREQSRAWAEAEFLGRWGEASLRGDQAEAQRLFVLAQSLGDALRRQSGEALLADAVDAIRRADPATQRVLAEAHATYRRGRIAYSRKQPAAAEPDLRRAAALFARARSPMSRMARHYAANTRFDQNDLAGARVELEALLAENGERSGYFACGALTRWQLSLCHTADGDAEGALLLLANAASALRRLDERNHLGFVESLLADTFSAIGRPDDSWSARIRSFEILSRDGRDDRLLANVASAADIERRGGNRESALALLALEREIGRGIHDDVLFSNTLVRGAVLSAEFGDAAGAGDLAREAAAVAVRITDPGFRAIVAANVQLARGAAALRSDPRGAEASLRSATDAYRTMGHTVPEIDSLLFRARAAQAFGDLEEAARAIDEGLEVYERFRPTLDSASELFAEGVRVSLERGQPALAFAYAERSRGRVGSIPSRVSGAALLEIVVLPEELVIFCMDDAGLFVAREKIARNAVLDLAKRCAGGDRAAAIALYDHLIRPVPRLRHARTLIVVADRPLDTVPFAALVDRETQRYLIEQCAVVFAESGASLRAAATPAPFTSAVAVALPSNLSETAAEAREVAQTYARGASLQSGQSTFASFTALARDAEVIHISGHTEDAGNGGTTAVVFAGPDRVPWRTIAASSFPRLRVAVLAACQTLRAGDRAPSLAGAFLAAGADDAIGTLQPIGDRDARELFRDVHRELAAGASPTAAVRRVQLRALARDRGDPAWSNLAVLTRVLPNGKEPL
jgi:tetratricopeptide (TPR) repeat protein